MLFGVSSSVVFFKAEAGIQVRDVTEFRRVLVRSVGSGVPYFVSRELRRLKTLLSARLSSFETSAGDWCRVQHSMNCSSLIRVAIFNAPMK